LEFHFLLQKLIDCFTDFVFAARKFSNRHAIKLEYSAAESQLQDHFNSGKNKTIEIHGSEQAGSLKCIF